MIRLTGLIFSLTIAFGLSCFWSVSVGAQSGLQIKPLLVTDKLKTAEAKKGFIDISNPSNVAVTVKTSVEAFRQVDDQGNLEFYASKEIAAGITPDLKEFDLGPREALRMYYLVEGQKLPPGDVFAVIFFSTTPQDKLAGVYDASRVGTLLALENGTPGPRSVDIDMTGTSSLQFGDTVSGAFSLYNPADPNKASGFFPQVSLSLTPLLHETKVDGPLLMAGNSRQIKFSLPTNRIGIYKLQVAAGSTQAERWLVVVTGWWRWVGGALVGLLILAVVWLRLKRSRDFKRLRLGKRRRP